MAAVINPRLTIRPMRRSDVDEVHAIELDSYPFPWSRGVFGDCMRIGYCCRVAERAGEICGYAILSVAAGEAHLLNLCIGENVRGQGLARLLLDAVLVEARLLKAGRLFLEVRPSNERAVTLYEKNGFRRIGRRPGYYPDFEGREDAIVMVHHLADEQ